MAMKGKFRLRNPEKYKGDPTNVVYRSSWERKFMCFCDEQPSILEWASEEPFMIIPYLSPVDNKWHRYFPDFWIRQKTKDGTIIERLIEVKPLSQTKPPVLAEGKKKTRRYYSDVRKWLVNDAKWKYARQVCEKRGWDFMILTEKQLRP